MAVFMVRGALEPFHRNVAESVANYFSEYRRETLKSIVSDYEGDDSDGFNPEKLSDLLNSDTVTAWAAKSEHRDLFNKISPGDYFILRTGDHSVRYIQEIEYKLGEEAPQELRQNIASQIWSEQYEYMWFSTTPVTEIDVPQTDFEDIIREVEDEYEFDDWFPAEHKNEVKIPEHIIDNLGGDDAFIGRLTKYGSKKITPGGDAFFLLNISHPGATMEEEGVFRVKQTEANNWQELADAENNGSAIVLEENRIIGSGNVGHISGEQGDDGIYKKVHLANWQPTDVEVQYDELQEIYGGADFKSMTEQRDERPPIYSLRSEQFAQLRGIVRPPYKTDLTVFDDDTEPITIDDTDLFFPQATKESIEAQVNQALRNGDHVLLVGPPGTGKSKLAKSICKQLVETKYEFVTANSDWSTFDTVGGYHPEKDGDLTFKPGVFLNCFKDERGAPQNEWLVIDEINRADIDKAFGSLFSVLAGDDVTLSFTDENDQNYRITCSGDPGQGHQENVYYVPEDWRMIATMNTFDKTSLYEMSYAFMRRWAFISVPVPELDDDAEELIPQYVQRWREDGGDEERYNAIAQIWSIVNKSRQIGPAIVEDIYDYVENQDPPDYESAISMYVIPQLEGLQEAELRSFLDRLEEAEIQGFDTHRVREFMEDYFQTKLES